MQLFNKLTTIEKVKSAYQAIEENSGDARWAFYERGGYFGMMPENAPLRSRVDRALLQLEGATSSEARIEKNTALILLVRVRSSNGVDDGRDGSHCTNMASSIDGKIR